MNETLRVLKERRSVRRYKAEQITEAELNAVLEAGTWAPSAKGLQTSVLVVVQDPETIAYMSRLNAEIQGNPGTDPFYGAPTVVVVLGDGEKLNWLQDGSLVMGNLMNAAAALGLGSCWINRAMELFDRPEGKELLKKWGLPETYRAWATASWGMWTGSCPPPSPGRTAGSSGCERGTGRRDIPAALPVSRGGSLLRPKRICDTLNERL